MTETIRVPVPVPVLRRSANKVKPSLLTRLLLEPLSRVFAPNSRLAQEFLWRRRIRDAEKARDRREFFRIEEHLQSALEIARQWGEKSPLFWDSLDGLAAFFESSGTYSQAEPLYRQVLDLREKYLPEGDMLIASSVNNLALLYYTIGRFDDAEPLYRRLLRILEEHKGKEDREVAVCLENYAALLRKLNRNVEGDKLRARAKAIRLKVKENS